MSEPLPPLNDRQQAFVAEYMVDMNATAAAVRAGYSDSAATKQIAHELMGRPHIIDAIASARADRAKRLEITADDVLRRLWAIATADPRELIEYRRTCCRYCHGKGFGYQHTAAELKRARSAWEAVQKKNSTEQFDEQGGAGYNGTKPPQEDCPECFGEGVERPFIHDTRKLSTAAVVLYAGVKTTKDGIEVKMHDQKSALVDVGKHLGMFQEQKEAPLTEEERIARIRKALLDMDAATTGTLAT